MTNSEKENLDEGEEDSDKNDHPLSREGWIMFLSGEINAIKTGFHTYWAVIIAVLVALFGGSIALYISSITDLFHDTTVPILAGLILLFAVVVYLLRPKYYITTQKEVESVETLRNDILKGLKDSNEILKRYLDAMGKSGEERDLEKSNKEQKEVLQVSQSDIRNIKESLRRIEDINDVSLYSSNWHIFGSSLIAIGFVVLSIGLAIFSITEKTTIIEETRIIGLLLIIAGAFMFFGTSIAGKNVNLYKKPWKNIWLLLGFVFACLAACLAIIYTVIG